MNEHEEIRKSVIETTNRAIASIENSIDELYPESDTKNKFLFRCRVVSLLFITHFNIKTDFKWEIKNE